MLFFAKSLGADPEQLRKHPYDIYVKVLTDSIRNSQYIHQVALFPVDVCVDRKGREIHRDRTVCSSTEDVLSVYREYPELIIPFMSVNPLRPDALERIDRYVAEGCRGAKLLQNYWGVDLNDVSLAPYFERLQEHGIPVVIHIGSEYSVRSTAACEGLDMLRQPLDLGVTTIAAHMGLGRMCNGVKFWRNFSSKPAWFDLDYHSLLQWLEQHDNLYGDLAAMLVPMRARALRHLSSQTHIHHKLLFASDYPVPFTVRLNTLDFPWKEKKRISRLINPFDRYVEVIMNYFPLESPLYSNAEKLLKLTDRLH
jgi:predicted TIM-barrel fold metal-dependent hydrolase